MWGDGEQRGEGTLCEAKVGNQMVSGYRPGSASLAV